jgi:hypothetical protein
MRNIVRLLMTVQFLLFALALVFCPKTAMAQGPVAIINREFLFTQKG